jgi:Tfp pilus assembly protein PilO
MPQFSAGDGLTLVLAAIAAAVSWGSHRQRLNDQGREIRDLKEAVRGQASSAVEIAELKAEVRHLRELIESLRDELRLRRTGAAE